MKLSFSPEDEQFRQEIASWLQLNLTGEFEKLRFRGGPGDEHTFPEERKVWEQKLAEGGWTCVGWSQEYGGRGCSIEQQVIFFEEYARAGGPGRVGHIGEGLAGPTIIAFGSEAQKQKYLPGIVSGKELWCQGYSEPGSGSDLASLQTRAVSDGDDYVINGTKIWTTHAHFANMMFCLVRTDASGKPQEGITFLLIDMATPGIKVEPIITLAGEHEVNQVFFDDVRVPKKNRVGEENDGWTVAKYLLEFERGGAYAAGLSVKLEKVRQVASQQPNGTGAPLSEDPAFKRRLGETEIQAKALEITEHRIMADIARTGQPGPASSMLKARGTETTQAIDELSVEALDYYVGPWQFEGRQPGANIKPIGPVEGITFQPSYLNNRAASIYGGSNEVQRNIMAKLVLGL